MGSGTSGVGRSPLKISTLFTLPDTPLGPEIGGRLTGIVAIQFDNFVTALTTNTPFPVTPTDATRAVAVLDAITQSLTTNTWATVPDEAHR